MVKRSFVVTLIVLLFSLPALSQKPDTLIRKLDSLSIKTDSAGGQINNTERAAYNENTRMTAGVYFILLGSDFKQQITKPFHMTGKDWGRLGIFTAATGGLMLTDESIQKYVIKLRENNKGLRKVSSYVTQFGGLYEAYVLVGLGAYGFIFKNEKMQTTTLLATQSYITSAVVAGLIKTISGRQRPSVYDPTHIESEPKFHGPFYSGGRTENGKRTNTSFPSGHTTAAFSAATVYAMEYKNRPWVPIVSYSAATLIGLSRVTENKHWFSDVFVGAALGYLTGRQVVNNYHRYSKLKAPEQKKNTVSFNFQYNEGVVMPGLVYKFR
ncbi:MAG: phosphatase PAP2 family protein [Chitinophagaceae bacterium]